MKKYFIIAVLLLAGLQSWGQAKRVYDPEADAMEQIFNAVAQADKDNKFVLCQVGGNWCPWCLRLAEFMNNEKEVKQLLDSNFVYVHINYSKENKNLEAMNRLHRPDRFGFPALVVLDADGDVVHIQNSAYLEEGKGYNKKKVMDFLGNWTPKAVMPDNLLTVMSFNIRNSSAYAEDGPNAWEYRRDAVIRMMNIESPDIIGLQEMLPDQVEYFDAMLPGYKRIGVGRDDGERQGEMMAIYYRANRYELVRAETRWLSLTPNTPSFGWDAACKRTVTIAHLRDRKDGKELVYLNTHLDHVGKEARKESILLLCEMVDYYAGQQIPVILGGDMNSDLESEIFQPIREHKLISAREATSVKDTSNTYNAYGRGKASQIDHLFTRGMTVMGFKTLTKDYGVPYISDHYPIKVLIKL